LTIGACCFQIVPASVAWPPLKGSYALAWASGAVLFVSIETYKLNRAGVGRLGRPNVTIIIGTIKTFLCLREYKSRKIAY
jgi:hypothetical protein